VLDFDFDPQAPGWAKQLAAFDLETTGLDLEQSRVVTACVAILDQNGEPTEVHEWLVNPGIEIPEVATSVHGITTEFARENGLEPGLAIAQIVQLLGELAQTMPLVAFNAAYDFSILHFEAKRYQLEPLAPKPVVDPLVLDRKMVLKRFGKRTLATLCQDYGVKLENAHNSTADAVAAGRLAQRMATKFPALDVPLEQLHQSQVIWADEWAKEFESYMKAKVRPDFQADLGWPVRN
jgi:DNA polymerase III subunit epsilon